MAITKVSYGGQSDGSGAYSSTFSTQNELFVNAFTGEIITEFRNNTVFRGSIMSKPLKKGHKGAKFPCFGTATGSHHVPGTNVLTENNGDGNAYMNAIKRGERLINLNNPFVAPNFKDALDDFKDEYDGKSIEGREMGIALAQQWDWSASRAILAASQGTAVYTGGPTGGGDINIDLAGGSDVSDPPANAAEEGQRVAAALFAAKQAFDEASIPAEGRCAAFLPSVYNKLAQNTDAINRDWGGSGAYRDGTVLYVAGFQIKWSNNIPTTDESAAAPAGDFNSIYLDHQTCVGMAWHETAAAVVEAWELQFEMEYKMEYGGHLMLAKMANGFGYTRPEAAIRFLSI